MSRKLKPFRNEALFALAILLTPLLSSAQTTRPSRPAPGAAGEEEIRAALRQLIPKYEQAVSSDNIDPDTDNLDQLKPFLAPDFSAVMVTSREVHSFDEMRQFWKDMKSNYIGKGGKYRVKVNYEPSIIAGDVVIARGTADEYVQSDRGNEFNYKTEWTAVFRKNPSPGADPASQWQMIRLHASMDPVFNDFTKLQTRRYRWFTIILAIILIAIIALVIFWMIRQRKARATPTA